MKKYEEFRVKGNIVKKIKEYWQIFNGKIVEIARTKKEAIKIAKSI